MRSYYSNTIQCFLTDEENTILGQLSHLHAFAVENQQMLAWKEQIRILQKALLPFTNGQIYFEFSIPRMGKRVDNIIIIEDFIFVLEFKVGETGYLKSAIDQTIDYCLDLQNFHEGSHNEKIVPVLISTEAKSFENTLAIHDNLFNLLKGNQSNITEIITHVLHSGFEKKINPLQWESSIYKPTPTIIQASQALYRGHSVSEISRSDAGAINLSKTAARINEIIENSKKTSAKSICFLTGVPGAGKTLAGLNIANERRNAKNDENAVFLSGNGPLVYVLREALIRDDILQSKERGEKLTKKNSAIKANAFIQNIHHFRDDNLATNQAPNEKVVIFDEAQRAWSKEKAVSFMKSKGKEFSMSEPAFLIDIMDRHNGYCTIICLIGGGQEINTGEAGLSEWINALSTNYSGWKIYYSNQITQDDNYLIDKELKSWLKENGNLIEELHLSVSVRSFRSEKISSFVQKVIDGNANQAKSILSEINNLFPIFLTRDFSIAKEWLRKKARGTERIGLVSSSGARRLKPLGIDVKNEFAAEEWFLNDANDVRSSQYLEIVATEFDIQGLEIDFVCLAWDINFYFRNNKWNYQMFQGTNWKNINVEINRLYLKNAYRVLMTRARQGLIIYIPCGDNFDRTRPTELYDSTYNFLSLCGIPTIDSLDNS